MILEPMDIKTFNRVRVKPPEHLLEEIPQTPDFMKRSSNQTNHEADSRVQPLKKSGFRVLSEAAGFREKKATKGKEIVKGGKIGHGFESFEELSMKSIRKSMKRVEAEEGSESISVKDEKKGKKVEEEEERKAEDPPKKKQGRIKLGKK